jgi:hypothetical protein
MVIYIASNNPLPLIPWRADAPAFNVTDLTEHELRACGHFTLPHVRQAGSHTMCGCGFNEGRQYPEVYDDPAAERICAIESSSQLASYIREHHVRQIYSCWSGDEGDPQDFERDVTLDDLVAPDFFFREKELLKIVDNNVSCS